MRILVVTGRSDITAFFKRLFEDQGQTYTKTHSLEEALKLHRRDPFELVVCDVSDEQKGWFDFCRKLRKVPLGEDSFLLAVTSKQKPAELITAVEYFADDFIHFPCEPADAEARFILAERRTQRRRSRRLKKNSSYGDVGELVKLVFPNTMVGCLILECVRDSDGEITDFVTVEVNQAFQKATGQSAKVLVQKSLTEVFPDIGATLAEKATEATLGKIVHLDLDYKRMAKHFRVSFYCADPKYVLVTFLETTEYRRAQEALQVSESRLQQTMDALPDIVYELAMDGSIVYANKSASKQLNLPLTAIDKMTIDNILPQSDRDRALDTMVEMMATGKRSEGERYDLIRADGTTLPVEAHAILLERDHGQPTVLGIARDISERIKAEEERRRMDKQIQKTQKLQSLQVLAGGLAHDFNNLLIVILGNASLAKIATKDNINIIRQLERVESAARKASELTDQMLAYAGKGQTTLERVDLGKTVEEILRLIQVSMISEHEIEWESDGTTPFIKADPTQIRQILINLVTNAAEASEKVGSRIFVRTGTLRVTPKDEYLTFFEEPLPEGTYSLIEVQDHGCGMDEATMAHMFEPFFSSKFTGRGLGLAATLGIIRSHDGAITVKSKLGEGTTVTVYFPQIPKPITKPIPAFIDTRQQDLPGWGTVLVIEEQKNVQDIAKEILESGGYTVITAKDINEGISALERHNQSVTAILIDLLIPQMDDKKILHKIIQMKPDVPIIASSGFNYKEAINRFAVEGLTGYIKKPYDATTLLSTVNEAADSRRKQN